MANKMVDVLAVIQRKGGVGKTTVSELVAEYGAVVKGKKILLAEVDSQVNLTEVYIPLEDVPGIGEMPPIHPELNDIPESVRKEKGLNLRSTIIDLFGGPRTVFPYETYFDEDVCKGGYIDVLPGNQTGLELLLERGPNERVGTPYEHLLDVTVTDVVEGLIAFFANKRISEMYDLVILDCAPSKSDLFKAALRAASHILVPYEPEEKSISGISSMSDSIAEANKWRLQNGARLNARSEPLNIVGFLPSKVDTQTNDSYIEMANAYKMLGKDKHFPVDLYVPRKKAIRSYTKSLENRPKSKCLFLDNLKATKEIRDELAPVIEYIYDRIAGDK